MSTKKLGFWTSSSLVVGNMIGSGVFLLPATLAAFGSISLLGWLISAVGAATLAYRFHRAKQNTACQVRWAYTYSRSGLGDFAGFLVAWGYWVSVWCTNAAIAVALVSYLGVFFPILQTNLISSNRCGSRHNLVNRLHKHEEAFAKLECFN